MLLTKIWDYSYILSKQNFVGMLFFTVKLIRSTIINCINILYLILNGVTANLVTNLFYLLVGWISYWDFFFFFFSRETHEYVGMSACWLYKWMVSWLGTIFLDHILFISGVFSYCYIDLQHWLYLRRGLLRVLFCPSPLKWYALLFWIPGEISKFYQLT